MRKNKTAEKALGMTRTALNRMDALGLFCSSYRSKKERRAVLQLITANNENLNRFVRGDVVGVICRDGEAIAFFAEDTIF